MPTPQTPVLPPPPSPPQGRSGEIVADDHRTFSDQVIDRLRRSPDAPNDAAELLRWLNERDQSHPPGLSRYLFTMWRYRADLNDAFPGVYLDPDARLRLQLWAHHFLASEAGAPPELVPPAPAGITDIAPPTRIGPEPPLDSGVVVVGYLRATLGLGDAARRLVRLTELAGERVRSLPYDHTDSPLGITWPDPDPTDTDDLDIVILAINASEAPQVRRALGPGTRGRYVIGLWFWELNEFPDSMAVGFDVVDEVWVTSEFTADAVRRRAPAGVAVRVIPLGADCPPIHARFRSASVRERFGISHTGTVVGTMFDYASRIERKNPVGLIKAWKRAFPDADRTQQMLFCKTLNGSIARDQRAVVEAAVGERTDVTVFDAQLAPDDRDRLMDQFDIVASLHRSEGYGLTLLDAMYRGIPVIATRYSGNLAFMTDENSWLVGHQMKQIRSNAGSYEAGGMWAEPDSDMASDILRQLVSNPASESTMSRVLRAQRDVAPLIDGTAGAEFIRLRLAELRARRAK